MAIQTPNSINRQKLSQTIAELGSFTISELLAAYYAKFEEDEYLGIGSGGVREFLDHLESIGCLHESYGDYRVISRV